jgi:hypothetical protein
MVFFKKRQYLRHLLTFNSFSNFKGRRPIKIRKKIIAVNPNINNYRLIPLLTPLKSRRTVPLNGLTSLLFNDSETLPFSFAVGRCGITTPPESLVVVVFLARVGFKRY